jgi:hypothetical protein
VKKEHSGTIYSYQNEDTKIELSSSGKIEIQLRDIDLSNVDQSKMGRRRDYKHCDHNKVEAKYDHRGGR